MIFDRIENLKNYIGIHTNLDTAINFLLHTDLESLPTGRTEVDGEHVFIQVSDAFTKEEAQGCYEYHRQYMDLQIGIEGQERILLGGDVGKQIREYQQDIGLAECRPAAGCLLKRGCFALYRAGEYHMPGIMPDDCDSRKIRKAVVKIAEQVAL